MYAKKIIPAALALALVLAAGALSACSPTAGDSATSGATGQSTASAQSGTTAQSGATAKIGVIKKRPELLKDFEIKVPAQRVLELTVQADADKWTASIADPKVVEFIPGSADAAPTFKPLIEEGSTAVVLKDPAGNEIPFTLTVTPGAR
ncbi:hypothetical protein I6B53_00145 [Schaalia sp. 19OD2882]|uniref:hypothetical protein n=1 Tax=Schaalia sp. 19OD2882 TaxID=2794089 RepID=UPI001C1EBD6B|nr:hypothetical protein [Schaalia sp. 19OD2882]QWW19599.1 hypothetical protein I6B53_00145 [Schaalia sp. 19OD2882]